MDCSGSNWQAGSGQNGAKRCPLWVKSGHRDILNECPLYPRKRTLHCAAANVRYVPCVDGSELARRILTYQSWSVHPCVRPLSAVHMTAGHNALRGSGPGQKDAFDDALARVGCPDRRIDRVCFTCCSPSQLSHHARILGAISLDPQRGRIVVPRARGHHCPSHSSELVG